MKIGIAADHAGKEYINILKDVIQAQGYEFTDITEGEGYDDYPDAARAIAQAIIGKNIERGILICGSGVGVSVAANKFRGVRAAVCHDCYSAHQGVEHDKMNVLCLGARIIGPELAKELTAVFLKAEHSKEERHNRRSEKIEGFENENFK